MSVWAVLSLTKKTLFVDVISGNSSSPCGADCTVMQTVSGNRPE